MANTTGKKYGGRQAGTPNKLTKEMRTALKNLVFDELIELPKLLDTLDAQTRLGVLIKLLPFVLPKVESENYKLGEGGIGDIWDW